MATRSETARRGRFREGVAPQRDTSVQIGPTGKKLLPLTVKNAG
ncbi:hypothetical protein [Streptomyces sp. NPDC057877]